MSSLKVSMAVLKKVIGFITNQSEIIEFLFDKYDKYDIIKQNKIGGFKK